MTATTLSELYALGNTIDTFALGHYARVYDAVDQRDGQPCAFKIMRIEHLSTDAEPRREAMAFINEANLLLRVASPHVNRLLDFGFIAATDENLQGGQIESYGLDIDLFRRATFRLNAREWRPYLALECFPRNENLLYLMKPNAPGTRWRLPTEEALELAFQFADLLRLAHTQRIVYLDHKLEHVYWDGHTFRLIDLNSSRLVEEGPQVLAQQIATDVHNLCVGILYPIFTGLSPQKGSLMPQPADQTGVDTRYSEINQLDFRSEPTLSLALQDLLQRGASRQLTTIGQFIEGLHQVADAYGWNPEDSALSPVREQLREGLAQLRIGQNALRDARDLFREAAIRDDINEEMESELRRLLGKINDMLNYRVVP